MSNVAVPAGRAQQRSDDGVVRQGSWSPLAKFAQHVVMSAHGTRTDRWLGARGMGVGRLGPFRAPDQGRCPGCKAPAAV